METLRGRVVKILSSRGYDFVMQPGGWPLILQDIAVQGDGFSELSEGDLVEFEIVMDTSSLLLFAVNVSLVDEVSMET